MAFDEYFKFWTSRLPHQNAPISLGSGCSVATEPMLTAARFWRTMQVMTNSIMNTLISHMLHSATHCVYNTGHADFPCVYNSLAQLYCHLSNNMHITFLRSYLLLLHWLIVIVSSLGCIYSAGPCMPLHSFGFMHLYLAVYATCCVLYRLSVVITLLPSTSDQCVTVFPPL